MHRDQAKRSKESVASWLASAWDSLRGANRSEPKPRLAREKDATANCWSGSISASIMLAMLSAAKAQSSLEQIAAWPSMPLGTWPTPIQYFNLPGCGEILVKRDDLAGFGRGGAAGVKARKLQGFLGDLRRRGCDDLIMPLANMTNLAFDLMPVLRSMGINARLFIVDDPPLPSHVRASLFESINDHVSLIGSNRTITLAYTLAAAFRARTQGKRAITVLPSPAHPGAVIGAAQGFIEMARQCVERNERLPSRVFVSAASGVTVAGFVLAEALLRAIGNPAIRIVAVQVCAYPLRLWIPCLVRWTCRRLGLPDGISMQELDVVTLRGNSEFGCFDDRLEAVCQRVASSFGLELDPIYGGKVWSTMEEYLRLKHDRNVRPAMFWHCGYSPDWKVFRTSPWHR
jgi:1-aminocyclopropane-1-carboxylate deaminase/D-cysteine desulfhydrase-like pyridoxal-dependent ACC family enzyme